MADAYVEYQYWPAKGGIRHATFVITLNELMTLADESPNVDDSDALLAEIYALVKANEHSEPEALDEMASYVEEEEEQEEDKPLVYVCKDCGMRTEDVVEEEESPGVTLMRCPSCNSENLEPEDES